MNRRQNCCIGHEKLPGQDPGQEYLNPGSCIHLQVGGAPCALCPCCVLVLNYALYHRQNLPPVFVPATGSTVMGEWKKP